MITASMTPLRRARLFGLLIVLLVFVAGIAVGFALPRHAPEGLTLRVTDRIPRELEELDLTATQRERIRAIIAQGQPRVQVVLEGMEPRMRAAFDSTDREIADVLTSTQRAALATARREHPPFQRQRHLLPRER
jgi:hypothetical protein